MERLYQFLYQVDKRNDALKIQELQSINDPDLRRIPSCFGYDDAYRYIPPRIKQSLLDPDFNLYEANAILGDSISEAISAILSDSIRRRKAELNRSFNNLKTELMSLYDFELPEYWENHKKQAVCIYAAFQAIRNRLTFQDNVNLYDDDERDEGDEGEEGTFEPTSYDVLTQMYIRPRADEHPFDSVYGVSLIRFFKDFKTRDLRDISWRTKIGILLTYIRNWDVNSESEVRNLAHKLLIRKIPFSPDEQSLINDLFRKVVNITFS